MKFGKSVRLPPRQDLRRHGRSRSPYWGQAAGLQLPEGTPIQRKLIFKLQHGFPRAPGTWSLGGTDRRLLRLGVAIKPRP